MRCKIIILLLADLVCAGSYRPQLRHPFVASDQLRQVAADDNDAKRGHAKLLQLTQARQTMKKVAPLKRLGYLPRYLQPPEPTAPTYYELWSHYPRSNEQQVAGVPKNHRPYVTAELKEDYVKGQGTSLYVRDHAPAQQAQATEDDNKVVAEGKVEEKVEPKKLPENLELSKDGDRVEFQIQGHEGPNTYVFGFDTGDGKNRQFRLEERLKDGTVKGHYGYYDARGKLRTIRYLARPFEGYREKHHVSNSSSE